MRILMCLFVFFFLIPTFAETVPVINYTDQCYCISNDNYPHEFNNVICHSSGTQRIVGVYANPDGHQLILTNPGQKIDAPVIFDPQFQEEEIGIKMPGRWDSEQCTTYLYRKVPQQKYYIVLEYYNPKSQGGYYVNQHLYLFTADQLNKAGCSVPADPANKNAPRPSVFMGNQQITW